jgi:hypothetical protein
VYAETDRAAAAQLSGLHTQLLRRRNEAILVLLHPHVNEATIAKLRMSLLKRTLDI